MADSRYAVGLLVRGCPNPEAPTNANPALFTSSYVASISGATGNLVTAQKVGRIARTKTAVDGFTSQVNLREPFSAGGNLRVKLQDAKPGAGQKDLSQLFAPDTPFASSRYWLYVSAVAYLTKTATSLLLRGPQPVVNDIIYCETEAMRVSAVAGPAGSETWTVTVSRGVLGTRAQEHTTPPALYPPGQPISANCLVFTDRPNFDDYSFETELHHFFLDGDTATRIDSYYRVTEGRPTPEVDQWTVQTKDIGKVLMDHQVKRPPVELSHAIQVNQLGTDQIDIPGIFRPFELSGDGIASRVTFFLTVYQAERLFNRRLTAMESDTLLFAEVDALAARYTNSKLRVELVCEIDGDDWIFGIDTIERDTGPTGQMIVVTAYWIYSRPGVVADSRPVGYPGVSAIDLVGQVGSLDLGELVDVLPRAVEYNQGFSSNTFDPIRITKGEVPPKVSLRIWTLGMRPIERFLTLCISKHGGGVAHATYDIIPGEVCPGVDSAFFNLTAGLSDPRVIDPATTKLLEMDALLTTVEDVPIDLAQGFSLGQEINRICKLYGLIRADVPEGITLRLLERGITTPPTDINQVVGKGFLVQQGQRLPAEKAFFLEGGWDPISLKPKWSTPLYVLNASASDLEKATRVRFWQQGASQSPEQIFAGPLGKLVQLQLLSSRGSPATYKVTTHRPAGARYTGDLVLWTDNSIPTAAGRGLTNARMKVIGRDIQFWECDQVLTLLADNLNTLTASEGYLAPALQIVRAEAVDATDVNLFVELLGDEDRSFDITTTFGIYQDLVAEGSKVRVVCEGGQNPDGERVGWLECDGRVNSIAYDGAGRSLISLNIAAAWVRDGYTLAELVSEYTSYVLLQDYQNRQNPTNAGRFPDDNQLVNGDDFAWVGPGDGSPPSNRPYGGNLSKIEDA